MLLSRVRGLELGAVLCTTALDAEHQLRIYCTTALLLVERIKFQMLGDVPLRSRQLGILFVSSPWDEMRLLKPHNSVQ